jgi:hypothetical protein
LRLEFGPVDPVQPINDLVGGTVVDIADEAQGDMIILDVDPSRARYSTPKEGQAQGNMARDFEGGEKSRHTQNLLESLADINSGTRNLVPCKLLFCG